MVAGLVMVELYKLILNASGKISRNIPLSTFKCAFLNLALPFVGFGEPIAASEKKVVSIIPNFHIILEIFC